MSRYVQVPAPPEPTTPGPVKKKSNSTCSPENNTSPEVIATVALKRRDTVGLKIYVMALLLRRHY